MFTAGDEEENTRERMLMAAEEEDQYKRMVMANMRDSMADSENIPGFVVTFDDAMHDEVKR